MTNNPERLVVLEMLKDDKISIEEATELLDAIATPTDVVKSDESSGITPKRLRILVDDQDDKVDITIPLRLVKYGIEIPHLPETLQEKIPPRVKENLEAKNINLNDLREMFSGDWDEVVDSLNDLKINVNDGNSSVRIFCE